MPDARMCIAPPHQANNNGHSPAFCAALNGHDTTLRVLAELRADLNLVTREFISIDGCLKGTTRLDRGFV